MNTLRRLQRQFAAHLLADDGAVAARIVSTPGADAATRLGVYTHAYRQRLREVLADQFPGLRALAGAADFDRWAGRYIRARPSRQANIRWYGADLADWLATAVPGRPAAAAMAQLEWALSTCFDAADQPAIDTGRLTDLPAADWPLLRLRLHPGLRMLRLDWNLDAIRRAVDTGEAAVPALVAEPVDLAIWRQDRRVRHRRLAAEEAAWLDGARQGLSFGTLCARAAERHPAADVAPSAAGLLRDWLDAGWIGGLDDASVSP